MSAERKDKKKEQLLDAGRTYGTIARTEPEVWAWLEKEEQLTGRKKHDILSEAIARLIIEREIIQKGLTMEQMLAAWDVKDRLEDMLFKKAMMLGTSIFGQLLTSVGEMVMGIRSTQEQRIMEIVEQEKKRDIDYQMRRTQAEMASKLMQALMPMIMATMSQIKIPGQPQTTAQPQQQETAEMEVELIE
ncbi:MAG: hypothetical protein QXW98_04715 [Candidatus Caldarchaeum sp.]